MPTENTPDTVPAYSLWAELATRITTQQLHYRTGDEETAARSTFKLFGKTRDLLEAHPAAAAFRPLALTLLNVVLRPYTTRWHGWMVEDEAHRDADGQAALVFRDELVRRRFRAELRELQEELIRCKAALAGMAGVPDSQETARKRSASLGDPIPAGIGRQIDITASPSAAGIAIQDEINAAEHAEILERRRILAGAKAREPRLTNAIGLALSGGGIRSATFCLGIVQVLVRKQLFAQFDYLSTVSGGGYCGTFLSCALGTNPAAGKGAADRSEPDARIREAMLERIDDVFHRQETGTESGLIRHLRNNSKFLLNGGAVAKMRIAGLLVAGILCNLLMVLPVALFAALLAYQLEHSFQFWGVGLPWWPGLESKAGAWLLWSVYAAGGAVLLLPLMQKLAHGSEPTSKLAVMRRVFVGIALFLGAMTVVATVVYLQPACFHSYETLRGALANHHSELLNRISGWGAPAAGGLVSMLLGVVATSLKSNWPRLKWLAAQLFILSGPLFFLLLYLMVGNRLGLGHAGDGQPWDFWIVLGAAIALLIWSALFVNINTLAPHSYYRARLCECYLARRVARPPATPAAAAARPTRTPLRKLFTGESAQKRTEALQQVRLTDLGANPAAPYHLLNTTLNLPASDNKELRGRNGDFFVVSRDYCGAPTVGYKPTRVVQAADPHFDLGTAMAVSAAAASASMGWKSLPNFRFLMTMLNVRLGYWLRWRESIGGAGVWYFFRELLASMNERCAFLNLSDGGHIENLGAYELLRRRCKFILCVDGGEEPGMECADLTRLQRYAEIDLGIGFEYGIADLGIQPNGFSRASAILVKITYPATSGGQPTALGWMIYLKLAVTGIEPAYVLDYRRENPKFPHESTGDQIYDEAQFEAYRRLGQCAAENLFRDELVDSSSPATVPEWFQLLANNLLADNDPVFNSPEQAMAAAGNPSG